jgi:hypothetical protein
MGIKKLFSFLNNNKLYKVYPYLNNLIDDLNIDKKKLLVGVDGNLFCHKYTHSYDNMLIGFFNQVLKFLSNKIIPLYIFDGGTTSEKEHTNLVRYNKKIISKQKLEFVENLLNTNNSNNTNEEKLKLLLLKKKLEKNSIKIGDNINIVLELFDLLNIPYIFSYGEGEYLAVLLNKYGIIDFFLTDDTDPIPACINKIIKFYNNNVYYLEINNMLEKLNLTKEQFCDFCILLGSDYNVFNHNLKPNELYELILKHKNIENIYSNYNPNPNPNPNSNSNPNSNENDKKFFYLNEISFDLINRLRDIYLKSHLIEREMFIEKNNTTNTINQTNTTQTNLNSNQFNSIIDHSNISYYSNIMLEFWEDFIELLSNTNDNDVSNSIKLGSFKSNIYNFISKSKFKVKNIIKFIKNNIKDITDDEISNMIISFDFLNTFGI